MELLTCAAYDPYTIGRGQGRQLWALWSYSTNDCRGVRLGIPFLTLRKRTRRTSLLVWLEAVR